MGCDYFFDEYGEFKMEFHSEHGEDDWRNENVVIHGKPHGRIYVDLLDGEVR